MNGWPETRDSLLVRLGNAEDRAAWDDFVLLYQPLIYRYARRRGLQDADARDVTQAVLCAVARTADQWQPGQQQGRFRGWLGTVAKHTVIDLLRKADQAGSGRTTVQQLLDQLPQPGTEVSRQPPPSASSEHWLDETTSAEWTQEYEQQLLRHAARIVRGDFSDHVWAAFFETTIRRRPIEEVAVELNKSVGSVYAARSRVMKRIAECVARIRKLESEQPPGASSDPRSPSTPRSLDREDHHG